MDKRNRPALAYLLVGVASAGRAMLAMPDAVALQEVSLTVLALVGYLLLGRLIAVSESYPDLKANQNFLELQAQLEGTENRISVARKQFNEVARTYNVSVRRFPANLVAKMFGFEQKPYFESAEGSEAAPQVQF